MGTRIRVRGSRPAPRPRRAYEYSYPFFPFPFSAPSPTASPRKSLPTECSCLGFLVGMRAPHEFQSWTGGHEYSYSHTSHSPQVACTSAANAHARLCAPLSVAHLPVIAGRLAVDARVCPVRQIRTALIPTASPDRAPHTTRPSTSTEADALSGLAPSIRTQPCQPLSHPCPPDSARPSLPYEHARCA